MKTIFLADAASDSGSLGFSDAWPLLRTFCQYSSLCAIVHLRQLTILPRQRERPFARQYPR